MRRAADAAPGPLSALAAAMVTFGARALRERRLAWAVIAEPVDSETETHAPALSQAFADEIESRIAAAIAGGHLPEQDAALAAAAAVGALVEGLIGPLAPAPADDPAGMREAVQTLTLNVLRGLGVVDARARGLIVQTVLPQAAAGAA